MKITTITTSVMRSYDYCHFEVGLSAETDPNAPISKQIDELHRLCIEMADRAVQRYQASKAYRDELNRTTYERDRIRERLDRLVAMRGRGETLAADDAAFLRGVDIDPGFRARLEGRKFDYEHWDDENPFRPTMNVAVEP